MKSLEGNLNEKENLNKLRCIKTKNSSFIGFYSFLQDTELLKEDIKFLNESTFRNKDYDLNYEEYKLNIDFPKEFYGENEGIPFNVSKDKKGIQFRKNREDFVLTSCSLDNSPSLLLLKKKGDASYVLKDVFKGEGNSIEELLILSFKKEIFIFVGFKIEKNLNKLYILKLKGNKVLRAFRECEYYYSTLFLGDQNKDGILEVVLYTKEIKEGYRIDVYSFKGDYLKKESKLEKYYYKKLINYYEDIIKLERDYIYIYYLAFAYYKAGEDRKAMDKIEAFLTGNTYYNLAKSLKELKKIIENK